MKFFPEIGSCCRLNTAVEEAATSATKPNIETAAGEKQTQRKFNGSCPAAATTHWRPSLSMISENGGLPIFSGVETERKKKKNVEVHAGDKGTSTEGKPAAKPRSFNGSKRDDSYHRSDAREMPIPVYSAAPFTF